MQITYETVTAAAARTIEMLSIKSPTQPAEFNQTWFERACGAFTMWEETVGHEARPEDREKLKLLLNDMPGVDDEGEGNWSLSPVVRL